MRNLIARSSTSFTAFLPALIFLFALSYPTLGNKVVENYKLNDPPVTIDDINSTVTDVNVTGNVITPNDTDPDGDALTLTAALADINGDG